MESNAKRATVAIVVLGVLLIFGYLVWPRGGVIVPAASGPADPGGDPDGAGAAISTRHADGGVDGEGHVSSAGSAAADDEGQDQSTDGRTDGAVPFVATPHYEPPSEDVVVLTPADLNRRRLEQVGLIEQSIAELDREISTTGDSSRRTFLMARREHLEGRRAELLALVANGQ